MTWPILTDAETGAQIAAGFHGVAHLLALINGAGRPAVAA